MNNPFAFGKPVAGEQFINRVKELKSLKKDILSEVNLILYSRRRTGKTSLILKIVNRLKKEGHKVIYLDLFQIDSIEKFVEYYAGQIARAKDSKLTRGIKWFAERLRQLKPRISFDDAMMPIIEIDMPIQQLAKKRVLSEVLALPEELAEARKKAIVVFDEFQEIINIGGTELEKELRAVIQHQKNVKYVFMGSKEHMIQQMFTDEERPFYQSGVIRTISAIDRAEFSTFITAKFSKRAITLAENLCLTICELAQDVPNYIQMLCYHLWNVAENESVVGKDALDTAIDELLVSQSDLYQNIMENLSLGQRSLCSAIAKLGGEGITSKEYLIAGRLSTSSAIYKNAQILVEKNILGKSEGRYQFKDPFFELWLKSKRI